MEQTRHDYVDNSLNHHFDVGVVGLWYGLNYGSILTYYALYELLRSIGKDPVMLPKPNDLWSDKFNDPCTIAQQFIMKRCNVFLPYPSLGEYACANDVCDSFVVGSDVVWAYNVCGREASQFFFLDWVKRSHKKIAYASSIGRGLGDDKKYVTQALRNLGLFDALSVREDDGVQALKKLTGREDIAFVMDPVFLCGKEFFSKIADECTSARIPEGSMFGYVLQGQMPQQKRHWAGLLAKHLGVHKAVVGNANDYDAARAIIGNDAILGLPVEEWIRSIRDSRFYMGDSYHGLCFSLLFHVQFIIVYPDGAPSKSRMTSLLGMLGLLHRIVKDPQTTDEEILKLADEPIDWDSVDEILADACKKSREWLVSAFDAPKRQMNDADYAHDEMLERTSRLALESRLDRDALRTRLDALESQIAELRQANADLQQACAEEEAQLAQRDKALADIESSVSYKFGRATTWLPRHARDLMKKRAGKG